MTAAMNVASDGVAEVVEEKCVLVPEKAFDCDGSNALDKKGTDNSVCINEEVFNGCLEINCLNGKIDLLENESVNEHDKVESVDDLGSLGACIPMVAEGANGLLSCNSDVEEHGEESSMQVGETQESKIGSLTGESEQNHQSDDAERDERECKSGVCEETNDSQILNTECIQSALDLDHVKQVDNEKRARVEDSVMVSEVINPQVIGVENIQNGMDLGHEKEVDIDERAPVEDSTVVGKAKDSDLVGVESIEISSELDNKDLTGPVGGSIYIGSISVALMKLDPKMKPAPCFLTANTSLEKALAVDLSVNSGHLHVSPAGHARDNITDSCVLKEPAECENQDGKTSVHNSTENECVMVAGIVNENAESVVETLATSKSSIMDAIDGSVTNETNLSCIADGLHTENRDQLVGVHDNDEELVRNNELQGDQTSASSQEGSTIDASDSQNADFIVEKRPFYYMIRIPRYDDGNFKEQIQHAEFQFDEKTKSRDALQRECQAAKCKLDECRDIFGAAVEKEKAARELLEAKQKEIDAVQSVISRVNNALSVEDIDGKIHRLEHMIQHETLPLKDEMNIIREIKQLKRLRGQQSSTMRSQDDIREAMDQKDHLEEHIKSLKKEAGLLLDNLKKAKAVTNNAYKKRIDATNMRDQLYAQSMAADAIQKEAYVHLNRLRKQLNHKWKRFSQYKDDSVAAKEMAFKGNKEELQNHCINQVEKVMKLWNNDEEFRKDYIRCNVRSTLRRLKTYDGRSLGPDEEPPIIPLVWYEQVVKRNSIMPNSNCKAEEPGTHEETEKKDDKPMTKVAEQMIGLNERVVEIRNVSNSTCKAEKSGTPGETEKTDDKPKTKIAQQITKPTPSENDLPKASGLHEAEETNQEEQKPTEEEEVRKAKELEKEEEEVRLNEQQRLENQKRSIEGMTKRMKDERAWEKEIEKQQKEADKKAKKKEKKKARRNAKKNAIAEETNNAEETKPTSLENDLPKVSGLHEAEETNQEEQKRTEEEDVRKAKELEKEEEEMTLNEQQRLENQKRSIEGMKTKRLKDKSAREKEIEKQQKEADKKVKKKEKKKARKKAKKIAIAEETNNADEGDIVPSSEPTESEMTQNPTKVEQKHMTVENKPQKRWHFGKQAKITPMPLPLRNRAKRRIQTWMWVILIVLIMLTLLFMPFFSKIRQQPFGF